MNGVFRRLNEIIYDLKNIRDDQTEIECKEFNCICEEFDRIIDFIEELKIQFKK